VGVLLFGVVRNLRRLPGNTTPPSGYVESPTRISVPLASPAGSTLRAVTAQLGED
jgi:hypothetical protein